MGFGMSIVESLIPDKIGAHGYVDMHSLDKLRSEEGHILVCIHAASWELYNMLFARGHNFAIFVQKQKDHGLDRFLNEQRRNNNIAVCFSLKELIRYIKRGYWVGIVVDAGAEDKAMVLDFLGNLIPSPGGAVHLAKKFHKLIYPVFGCRENSRHQVLKLGPVLDCQRLTIRQGLEKLNVVYEEFLRKYPQEYMWWYKRFKRKRNRRIVILSDGKAGHLKQSLTVQSFFEDLGYRVDGEIIELKVSNKQRRILIEGCAMFSGKRCLGCLRCLRLLLDNAAGEKLSRSFADIVISTGSALAGINVIFSNSQGAKSIVVLKPNISVNKFSLAIVPEHDKLLSGNAVNIKGALSIPICGPQDKLKLTQTFSLSSREKIAVFIGGPLENKDGFFRSLRLFIEKIKEFSSLHNIGLLVTTSRRSPVYVENVIEKELRAFSNTEVLVIANRRNYPFIVGGFLSVCDTVFITSDSISMVSESLGMKKATVCVILEDILNTHHINFFSSIEELANFLSYPYNIGSFKKPPFSLFDYNRDVVKEAIKRVL